MLFDVFRLPLPDWTDNFQHALLSVGEYNFSSSQIIKVLLS